MHFPPLLILSLLILLLPSTYALDSPVSPALSISTDSSADIIPISVSTQKSLRELQTAYTVAESTRLEQRQKFAQIQSRFANTSESERPLLSAQLSQQRQRVLFSTLNAMILIYQRADYLVNQFDKGLLSMRSKYRSTQNTKRVSSFSSRAEELDTALSLLKQRSSILSQTLSKASSSIELSRDLPKMKKDLALFLKETQSFSSDYRSLAEDVVSSK